jgi:predicted acetyltransferase
LCLVKREIEVDQTRVWVAGIGGVATHPDWQHQGFATRLMRATEKFMREKMEVPFGLLVCANRTRSFYESVGWKHVANELVFAQKDATRHSMKTNVMISILANEIWPLGVIDLCGLPW